MKIIEILSDDSHIKKLDKVKRDRIEKKVGNLRAGLHTSAPVICTGHENCKFIRHCPIPEIDENGHIDYGDYSDYPINQLCIMESMYMKQKLMDYINYLKIDPENAIELSIANDLALCDLWKNRATMILSAGDNQKQGQDLLRVDVTTISDNGQGRENLNMSTTTQMHPLTVLIDRIEARRLKIISELDQSRKAKNSMILKMTKTKENSKLLEELSAMRKLLENNTSQMLLKVDEPIEVKG